MHAALSVDDLKCALGERLELLADESIPFDDGFCESPLPREAWTDTEPEAKPEPEPEPAAAAAAAIDTDTRLQVCHLNVGYGWRLYFEFKDGEAHGVRMEALARHD